MDDRRTKRGLRSRNPERSEDEKPPRPTGVPATGGGGIFKSAAVAVLRQHRKLMTTGDITRLAVEMGLLKCQGKTPEATMASALYTDVKRKLQKSLFTRPQEGLFGLREWLEEGYYPEGWVGPPDGLGLAPFKRRNNAGSHQGGGTASASASKAGRQGVRTGPGRSSKARAARSWRNAGSDAEDDEAMDEDDDMTPTGRSHTPGSLAATPAVGSTAGAAAAAGDEDEADEGLGEGEDMDAEEEAEDADEVMDGGAEGQDERLEGRQAAEEAATTSDQHAAGGKDTGAGPGGPGRSQHAQPAASPPRRGGRGRTGGGGEGAIPQDECMSPLHMLGEAAASESMSDMGGDQLGSPPAKRKRPSSIMVPDRAACLGGVEGATPKSPYEDSLAALHEIATSPSTFELTSQQREQQQGGARGSGEVGSGKVGRARPRLHVDVPNNAVEGPGNRRDGTPGTTLLTDNPMLQGETTPAILLQASPVTTASGQQAMVLRQAPVLVTLPPALASPTAAAGGQLDTPALLHVQLPGGAPSELMQTTLITPTGQQLTPFRSHAGGLGTGGRGGLLKADGGPPSSRPPGRRVSFSGQVGILGPPSAPGSQLHQPLQPPASCQGGAAASAAAQGQEAAAAGGHAWPPRLTPEQVESELFEVTRMQTVVERLESKLGNSHPQVGKAWLAISRMYQHIGEAERNNGSSCMSSMARAAEALGRTWAVCRACAESCGATVQCEEALRYLTARTSEAALEGEGAAAAGGKTVAPESGGAAEGTDGAHAHESSAPAAGSGAQEPASAVVRGDEGALAAGSAPPGGGAGDQQPRHDLSGPSDPMAVDGLEGAEGGNRQPVVAVQG